MEIVPYPEEQKCQNCHYARSIPNNPNQISCRYGKPNVKAPYWPEIDNTAWCGKWVFNTEIKPLEQKVTYTTNLMTHEGVVKTFSTSQRIIEKRIKEQFPQATNNPAQNEKIDPWGFSR